MNKTLLTVFKVVLHVIGWPVLLALLLILNLDVIKGGSMYGIAVFVCFIVAVVMAIVYYLAYFLVRTKKSRSIRNQHIIIAIVAVCCLSGFWMLLDVFIPAPLETATGNTIRWEDLSDNWGERAEVQEKLLSDYVTINYRLGRLKALKNETIEDYIRQGPDHNEELHDLLFADYNSIDGDGYSSYQGPGIDYAQSGRMTIPVLLHLFLDDRSDVQGANSAVAKKYGLKELTIAVPYYNAFDFDSADPLYEDVRIYHGYSDGLPMFYVTDQDLNVLEEPKSVAVISRCNGKWTLVTKCRDGKETVEGVQTFTKKEDAIAAARDHEEGFDMYFYGDYKQATVNWHVLDMMGTAMDMMTFDEAMMKTDLVAIVDGLDLGESMSGLKNGIKSVLNKFEVRFVADVFQMDLVPDALAAVADFVAEDELLGSPIYIGIDENGTLTLNPSNAKRGVLGYMETAWLYNQGLLYIIVSLFSTRTLFLAYGPFMALIAIMLGFIREKEAQLNADDKGEKAQKDKQEKKSNGKKAKKESASADDLVEDEPETPSKDDGLELV